MIVPFLFVFYFSLNSYSKQMWTESAASNVWITEKEKTILKQNFNCAFVVRYHVKVFGVCTPTNSMRASRKDIYICIFVATLYCVNNMLWPYITMSYLRCIGVCDFSRPHDWHAHYTYTDPVSFLLCMNKWITSFDFSTTLYLHFLLIVQYVLSLGNTKKTDSSSVFSVSLSGLFIETNMIQHLPQLMKLN